MSSSYMSCRALVCRAVVPLHAKNETPQKTGLADSSSFICCVEQLILSKKCCAIVCRAIGIWAVDTCPLKCVCLRLNDYTIDICSSVFTNCNFLLYFERFALERYPRFLLILFLVISSKNIFDEARLIEFLLKGKKLSRLILFGSLKRCF
jgi:hypothetical protein